MYFQVDGNSDNSITYEELRDWVDKQRISYMWETLDNAIKQNDDDKDGSVSWKEYKHSQYGIWDDAETQIDPVSIIRYTVSGTFWLILDTSCTLYSF